MDTQLISRLNALWQPVYPYLAQWINTYCPEEPRSVLELGPFSGGISRGFKGLLEDVRTLCLMCERQVAETIREQFGSNVEVLVGSPERLPLRASFDLAIYRGAFFFLTPEVIRETYRVLNPAGRALLGGGYGPLTPPGEIAKIAEESKRLNYQLGKKWISTEALKQMIREAGMARGSRILEEGGLWLLLEKE